MTDSGTADVTPRRVRLADVAERAGVDRSIVSRLINNDSQLKVRPATRERVMQAIKELGYRPNAAARSLRTARAGAFGLVIPDFANPVYARIIKGAEAAAATNGNLLLTASSSGGKTALQEHLNLLTNGRVDGMLLAGSEVGDAMADALDQVSLPWLLVNRSGRRAKRWVVLDDEGAAAMAVEHLLELGHTRIGHVSGPPAVHTAKRRRAGYVRAMRKAGLEVDEDLIVEADYTDAGGAQAVERLLRGPTHPTALLVANVASAIGAMYALTEAGVRIPRDVSVVAIHDLPMAGCLIPPLTTVAMPLEELGRRAIELLESSSPDEPIREIVAGPMALVVRRSTAAPRK